MIRFTQGQGPQYRLTFCDLCGSQQFVKDVRLITDRYSKYYNKLSCHSCYQPVNPQQYPFRVVDKIKVNPRYTRNERLGADLVSETQDQLPGAPTNIRIQYDYWNECLRLDWDAPNQQGSSAIIGYKITRAEPQGAYYWTLSENTGISSPYYKDLTADSTIEYSYIIYAINSFGTGAIGGIGYWPEKLVSEGLSYVFDGDFNTILDGNGDAILDGASV